MKYLPFSNFTKRNLFTRQCIGQAITELLKSGDFEHITVSDIVKKALTLKEKIDILPLETIFYDILNEYNYEEKVLLTTNIMEKEKRISFVEIKVDKICSEFSSNIAFIILCTVPIAKNSDISSLRVFSYIFLSFRYFRIIHFICCSHFSKNSGSPFLFNNIRITNCLRLIY